MNANPSDNCQDEKIWLNGYFWIIEDTAGTGSDLTRCGKHFRKFSPSAFSRVFMSSRSVQLPIEPDWLWLHTLVLAMVLIAL
jgi:hypothetical protein